VFVAIPKSISVLTAIAAISTVAPLVLSLLARTQCVKPDDVTKKPSKVGTKTLPVKPDFDDANNKK
jgi:hypothetical protein